LELVRYIHLNPVRAGIVGNPKTIVGAAGHTWERKSYPGCQRTGYCPAIRPGFRVHNT
jgi:hypothetical protein